MSYTRVFVVADKLSWLDCGASNTKVVSLILIQDMIPILSQVAG